MASRIQVARYPRDTRCMYKTVASNHSMYTVLLCPRLLRLLGGQAPQTGSQWRLLVHGYPKHECMPQAISFSDMAPYCQRNLVETVIGGVSLAYRQPQLQLVDASYFFAPPFMYLQCSLLQRSNWHTSSSPPPTV